MRKIILALTFLSFGLTGCAHRYKLYTATQLHELVVGEEGALSDLWRGTFYCGSDKEYDYFVHKRELASDIHIKLRAGVVPLPRSLPFPSPSKYWINMSQSLKAPPGKNDNFSEFQP